jgi:hypothetical protein
MRPAAIRIVALALALGFVLVPSAQGARAAGIAVAAGCTTVPLHVVLHHAFVEARIDGVGGYAFALDTGASAFLFADVARERGIAYDARRADATGINGKRVSLAFARPRAVRVGGLALDAVPFAVGDFGGVPPLAPVGMRFAGLLGNELFARFATTFDVSAGTVTFCRPDRAALPPWPVLALDRTHGNPRIAARVDGVPGSYDFDTGSSLGILTQRGARGGVQPAVVDAVIGRGIDGPLHGDVARRTTLAVGDAVLDEPLAFTAYVTRGPLADDAGNLGMRVWEHFDMVLDYAHDRVFLHPAAAFAERMIYDRAGMTIEDRAGVPTIASVVDGGPAAQAGLRAGDVVAAFDGMPADRDTATRIAQEQVAPLGTTLALDVVRDGMPLAAAVVLAELV